MPPFGWASWVRTNGATTESASLGPMSTRIALTAASCPRACMSFPPTELSRCTVAPTITVAGTRASVA